MQEGVLTLKVLVTTIDALGAYIKNYFVSQRGYSLVYPDIVNVFVFELLHVHNGECAMMSIFKYSGISNGRELRQESPYNVIFQVCYIAFIITLVL